MSASCTNTEVLRRGALTIVHRLEVIHEREDVLMSHRHPLEDSDLVPHHVLPPGHEPLVDDLGGIVAARVDVHAFFHHAVGPSPQRFAGLVSTRLHLRRRWLSGHLGRGRSELETVGSRQAGPAAAGGKGRTNGCPAEVKVFVFAEGLESMDT